MQEIEFKRYEEIGNWDFSDIKYTVEQDSDWDFYKEISKYSKSNSLILDLGTGGGEKALAQMPNVGMIIATDFSELDISNNTHRNQIEEELFNKYVAEHATDKGIELKRILYGIIAKK